MPPKIELDIDWAERKLGRPLPTEEVVNIFKSLVFGVEQTDARKLLLTVPTQLRESGYGMGSTSFEVIMSVTLPYVRRSAIGAVMLGLGRALGETMAVTFIIGNSHAFPKSLFDSGSTIASTIANEFTEATSPMHTAALISLGLVLFLITFVVLGLARLLLRQQGAKL